MSKYQRKELAAFGMTAVAKLFEKSQEARMAIRRRLQNGGEGMVCLTTVPAGAPGAWQEAHRHDKSTEAYFVLEGRIARVWRLRSGQLEYMVHNAGEYFDFKPGLEHNVFVPGGATFITVRYGEGDASDRFPASDGLERFIVKEYPNGFIDELKKK